MIRDVKPSTIVLTPHGVKLLDETYVAANRLMAIASTAVPTRLRSVWPSRWGPLACPERDAHPATAQDEPV